MSLVRNAYYAAKPFLPRPVRHAFRRALAARVYARSSDVWPVKKAALRAPANWPGWPEGKRFAVVLTHDVESSVGLDRTLRLAEMEARLGFRSSFNFIPEGGYRTPATIRQTLVNQGFEVGVHDLRHDGKLYRSKAEFDRHAASINRYLREWQAVGFRSGFMLHRHDWLHQLDIEYDMSSFDTDPFEPQPDGVNTIFPFWVPAASAPRQADPNSNFEPQATNCGSSSHFAPRTFSEGYVELPYTLAQDSTLFLYLGHKDIDCWLKKLDCVVAHGGMALLNVHPDYLTFSSRIGRAEFPAAYYEQFLLAIRQRYEGQYWLALPRDVARFARGFRPARPLVSGKRVCMLSYSFYESDNRVMRYADALVARGDRVDAIALAGETTNRRCEVLNGVSVSRIQHRARNERGKLSYLFRLLRFCVHSSIVIAWRHLWHPYDCVHVHNVPDFLVFAAWFPKLLGARVILDIHDIVPEFFASKFGPSAGYIERLMTVERASCAFADHVIISNHLWRDRITRRSVPASKCSVVLNYVDQAIFFPRPRDRRDDRIIAIFPGGIQAHQGLDVAIRAFGFVVKRFRSAEFHVYGEGTSKQDCLALVSELGLDRHVHFFAPLPIHQVADKISNADIGLVPKRADSFGNEAYSTKIMEFMSQGIPVVASRTKIDSYYFNDSQLAFFESGNPRDMADKIVLVLEDRRLAERLVGNGNAYVAGNNWDAKKQEYFDIVDDCVTACGAEEFGVDPKCASINRPEPVAVP